MDPRGQVDVRGALDPRLGHAARFALLGGLVAGLLGSALIGGIGREAGIAAVAAIIGLVVVRPRGGGWGVAAPWLALLALGGALTGAALGGTRLAAIDAGAADLPNDRLIRVAGYLEAVPRRADGEVRLRIASPAGRLLVAAREPVPELAVGREVAALGTVREPAEWERAYLARLGIAEMLAAEQIWLTGRRRGGLAGALDRVRDRAEAALGRGTPEPAANLLRGFVLGQDDRIEPASVDAFKASGLAHLLAVSGQNVILLGLLAGAVLGVLGVPRRARLLWVLALIAVYVPVAGAGPSIQRAGVMGAAGLVAALASRPSSRWYAVLLAAAVTLAINPRAGGDVGWQLSFAAVIGILVWAAPIQALLARALGSRRAPIAALAAEGAALTIAATLTTAPLMAHHFEAVSVAALPANLVALPAVAPVMWAGMIAAAAGQLPWLPVEPVTVLAGALAGYIAQVADWFAAPGWAQVEARIGGPAAVAAAYAALAVALTLTLRALARRRGIGLLAGAGAPRGKAPIAIAAPACGAAALVALGVLAFSDRHAPPAHAPGLRLTFLDVGQGDAILLEPRRADPVLVDAGPPEAEVAERLAELGVERLAALIVTHPESDHAGGAAGVIARIEVGRVLQAQPDPAVSAAAHAAGVAGGRIARGAVVRAGRLRLEALWPPRELLGRDPPGDDPNRLSVVLLARWRGFEALLSGDAEAEQVALDPGAVEVLKLAHHGSADSGLAALLERARPQLAVASVGAGNPYGHPDPGVVATLADAGVPLLRTDRAGDVVIEVAKSRFSVR